MTVISAKKAHRIIKNILKENKHIKLIALAKAISEKIKCRRKFALKIAMLLITEKRIKVNSDLSLRWFGK